MSDDKTFTRDLYEVTGGKVHQVTESGRRKTFVAGDRFRPTVEQLERGALKNQVRKAQDGGPPIGAVVQKDIGLRTLQWGSEAALKKAIEHKIAVDDMERVQPTGVEGYVSADVTAAIAARDQHAKGKAE